MPVPAVKVWTVRDFSSPPVSPSCRIISLHVSHLVFIINSGFYFFQKLDGRSLLKLNFAKNSEGKGASFTADSGADPQGTAASPQVSAELVAPLWSAGSCSLFLRDAT